MSRLSKACEQGRHDDCTETLEMCACTYRGLHKTPHRYASAPAASEGGTGTNPTEAQLIFPGDWLLKHPDYEKWERIPNSPGLDSIAFRWRDVVQFMRQYAEVAQQSPVASVEGQRTPMEFTDEESTDPNVIQHIKPENRTENERLILAAVSDAGKEQFEAWARQLVADKPFDLTPCDNPSCGPKFHHYLSDATNGAWSAWQAARRVPVEGQRTGEEAVDPEGDAAYWRARAETAELKVLTFHEEIAKLKSVPGVEGMGAREMWKDWPGPGKDIVLKLIEGGVSLEDADRMDRNIEAFAEAFHNQACSLRGAGGEGEADSAVESSVKLRAHIATKFGKLLNEAESREQAMRECLGKLVELLSRIEPTMYNPFEPDNQSKNYIAVKAAIENADKLVKP